MALGTSMNNGEPDDETVDWSVVLDVEADTEEEANALARRALTAEALQSGQQPDLAFRLVAMDSRTGTSWWRRLLRR